MVPRTFPSTYQTANGETRMVVFFLSSVSGLRKWVDYIPVKFTMLETQVNNSYNNNGVILVDPLSSTTNRQAWVDYVPVFVDANDTAAWRVDANGFIPVGFSTKPTLNLDFAGTKTLDSRVTFTRASNATYFDANGVLQTAASGVARFDHNPTTLQSLGLLIEEQRTNSIRNNTMQGAVAGTPGTDPNFWAVASTGSGITREIVGTGVEDGITYVDYRYSGTPSAGTNAAISFEQVNQIAASSGQTWTESVYLKLQAGSFSGTTTSVSLLATNGTSGTENFPSSTITSTPTSLKNSRFSVTGTLSSGLGTTHIQPRVRIGYTVGTPFDITLRIGLPQLELGAFATSVIPTTVAAATRNADVATMTGTNFSSWYNATEGTLYCEASVNATSGSDRRLFIIDDSVAFITNGIVGFISNSAQKSLSLNTFSAGANTGRIDSVASFVANALVKNIVTYANSDRALSSAGASAVTSTTAFNVPSLNRLLIGAEAAASGGVINGHIRKLAYYPVRLSNDQLQALTR